MDAFLPQLLAFPPHPPPKQPLSVPEYDKQIKALVKVLNSASASKFKGKIHDKDDLLDVLDPSINTLPYLYALLAQVGGLNSISPTERLWGKMLNFVTSFDPVQVRYTGHEWRRLLDAVVKGAEAAGQPSMAIDPVRTAMLRLDPLTATFTSTHLVFARICLKARAYDLALPILNNSIYHFPTASEKEKGLHLPPLCASHLTSSTFITTGSGISEKLTYRDHLQYFLYGAMIYLGMKHWERALLFLEIVMTLPTLNTASLIQVEAYKKWILVNLLLRGHVPVFPRNVNSQAAKHYHAIGKAYEALAESFKDQEISKLYATAEAGQDLWHSDQNTGLVVQVLAAHRRFALLALSKTYTSILLTTIAALVPSTDPSLEELYTYINSLISEGHLQGTLSSTSDISASILRFDISTTKTNHPQFESQQYAELVKQKRTIEQLGLHMHDAQRKLEFTKEYLDAIRKAKKTEGKGEERHGSPNITFNDEVIDEEMLADF